MFSGNFRRGEEKSKGKTGSKVASKLADFGWNAFQTVNKALPEDKIIQPARVAEPLLKSYIVAEDNSAVERTLYLVDEDAEKSETVGA